MDNLPTYTGKNEINMARKTLTPYYHYPLDTNADGEYVNGEATTRYYAFLYPEDQTWTDFNTSRTNIITDTSGVDITNCEVIELRNLIDFTDNTVINIDISLNDTSDKFENSGKKTITFVTSGNTIHGDATELPIWKDNRKLINNSVKSKYNSTEMRSVYRRFGDGYRISFNHQDKANTQKHIYVMDIASGSYLVKEDDINIFSSKDDSNGAAVDTFIGTSFNWDKHKELVSFRANVYQIKLNQSSDDGTIERENGEFLNFSLDGLDQQVSI